MNRSRESKPGTTLTLINACLPHERRETEDKSRDALHELVIKDGVLVRNRLQRDVEYRPEAVSYPERQKQWFQSGGLAVGLSSNEIWDLEGRVVLPGLVDAHMHLDKAFSLDTVGNRSGTLLEAVSNYRQAAGSFVYDEILERIRRAVVYAVSYGTTAIRTHVNLDPRLKDDRTFENLRAALAVKEDLAPAVTMQVFPMVPYDAVKPAQVQELAEEALRLGADGLGGAPHLADEPDANVHQLFKLAAAHDKPVDLHADESDDPSVCTVTTIARETERYGYQGRVVVGHLCSLAAMDEDRASRVIERIHQAGIGVVTLPGANMYLQGRGDRGLVRRGTTRVSELQQAGVPVAAGSDNILDPFHPFGRGDLLLVGLLTGYAAHLGGQGQQRKLLRMISQIPARLMGAGDGLQTDQEARFVILDTSKPHEIFALLPRNRVVYSGGRIVSWTREQSWIHF